MIDLSPRPNERRHFVHKRIGAGLKSFVTSGFNPIAGAGAFLAPVRPTPPRSAVARSSVFTRLGKDIGRNVKFSGTQMRGPASRNPAFPGFRGFTPISEGCIFPFKPDPVTGRCRIFAGGQEGPDDVPLQIGAGLPGGDVVMGRYGAAEVPGQMIVNRAVCRPGMVVADDGLCYNRSQIRNNQRQWPRGRRPLLTGGDMRAISTAARAGARLERTTKRLQKIGLMKKPSRPAARRITSGSTEHHHHD